MTATYWSAVLTSSWSNDVVEIVQTVLQGLEGDSTAKVRRGITLPNLYRMRQFYQAYSEILSTPSREVQAGKPFRTKVSC